MSHNPPNPELLDAADRRGLLVWDVRSMRSRRPAYFHLLQVCATFKRHVYVGVMVVQENRLFGDFETWYQDMSDMIKRDRNHPSIIW